MNPPIFITSPKSFDRELFHFLINIPISGVKHGEYRVGIMAGRVKEKARANPHRTPCEFNDLFPIRKDIPYDHWAYIPEKLERALLRRIEIDDGGCILASKTDVVTILLKKRTCVSFSRYIYMRCISSALPDRIRTRCAGHDKDRVCIAHRHMIVDSRPKKAVVPIDPIFPPGRFSDLPAISDTPVATFVHAKASTPQEPILSDATFTVGRKRLREPSDCPAPPAKETWTISSQKEDRICALGVP